MPDKDMGSSLDSRREGGKDENCAEAIRRGS